MPRGLFSFAVTLYGPTSHSPENNTDERELATIASAKDGKTDSARGEQTRESPHRSRTANLRSQKQPQKETEN